MNITLRAIYILKILFIKLNYALLIILLECLFRLLLKIILKKLIVFKKNLMLNYFPKVIIYKYNNLISNIVIYKIQNA